MYKRYSYFKLCCVLSLFLGGGVAAQVPTNSNNYVMETVVKTPNRKTAASLANLPVD
jgi:hypothetical protein